MALHEVSLVLYAFSIFFVFLVEPALLSKIIFFSFLVGNISENILGFLHMFALRIQLLQNVFMMALDIQIYHI